MLAARGLKATFFVVGEPLRAHRALAERARRRGPLDRQPHAHPPAPARRARARRVCEIEATQARARRARAPRPPVPAVRRRRRARAGPAQRRRRRRAGRRRLHLRALERGPGRLEGPAGWVERALAQIAAHDWTLLVLHDVEGACADRLEEFLTRVDAEFARTSRPAASRSGAVRSPERSTACCRGGDPTRLGGVHGANMEEARPMSSMSHRCGMLATLSVVALAAVAPVASAQTDQQLREDVTAREQRSDLIGAYVVMRRLQAPDAVDRGHAHHLMVTLQTLNTADSLRNSGDGSAAARLLDARDRRARSGRGPLPDGRALQEFETGPRCRPRGRRRRCPAALAKAKKLGDDGQWAKAAAVYKSVATQPQGEISGEIRRQGMVGQLMAESEAARTRARRDHGLGARDLAHRVALGS